jgi:VWFA-related protein
MARSRLVRSIAPVLTLALVATGHAQRQSQPPRQPPQHSATGDTSEVRAIIVDVVVRDKEGNPVTDLTAPDFEIFEDGAKQELGSLTPVIGPPPAARRHNAGAGATVTPVASKPTTAAPQVMALVFDRLTPEGRALARTAALGYIGNGEVASNTIAVFGVDLALTLYQPFTRDAALLKKSIETAGERATSQYGASRAETNAAQDEAIRQEQQANAASATAGPGNPSPDVGGAASAAQFAQMQAQMQQSFFALERDQQGYATSNALMAIVNALKAIPGRKSVIFFSEGLSIPPNVQRQFISVIDAANRANVSIYPMDAAGLRTDSPLKESREGINAGSRQRIESTLTSDDRSRPMMEALERNEDLLRADPHSGLGTLADQTGGFLIANTNDLRGGFERIDTDMRNYYVLTYVPKNTRFDGKFREIDVKVHRPGVQVRSRKGYFAVRAAAGTPTLNYEAPAMAVLEQSPPPNAFPVRAIALRFPEEKRTDLVPVLVNVPIAGVSFRESNDQKSFGSDFTVLVRFKDDAGQIVDKVSQHYQISAPAEQLERVKAGDVLFYREPVLYPGVFTMETVVYDAFAGKASTRFQTVDVNALDAKALRISSVIAIRGAEKVPATEHHEPSPLYVGDQLLYPNMGEPLSKAANKELPFYFVAYPATGAGETSALIELLSNGKSLGQAPLKLSAADPQGHIAQLSHIPIDALQPGNYELRVTLQQGSQRVARVLPFKVAP